MLIESDLFKHQKLILLAFVIPVLISRSPFLAYIPLYKS